MNAQDFKKHILPLQDKMYRYALSIVFDNDLANDIVQEVLMKLWDRREQLSEINNVEAWCIRMIRNKSLDKLKLANRRNVDLQQAEQKQASMLAPDRLLEENDLLNSIYDLMKDLSEQQREIFRLRDLLGYSNREIKEITGLSDGQVKVNLYRARQKIKQKLGKLINYGL